MSGLTSETGALNQHGLPGSLTGLLLLQATPKSPFMPPHLRGLFFWWLSYGCDSFPIPAL